MRALRRPKLTPSRGTRTLRTSSTCWAPNTAKASKTFESRRPSYFLMWTFPPSRLIQPYPWPPRPTTRLMTLRTRTTTPQRERQPNQSLWRMVRQSRKVRWKRRPTLPPPLDPFLLMFLSLSHYFKWNLKTTRVPCFGTYNNCLFKTIVFIFIYATITVSFDEISFFSFVL